MKTIFIPITSGFAARNILLGGVLKVLRQNDFFIVLLVPFAVKKDFESVYASSRVIIEAYPQTRGIEKKLISLRYLGSFGSSTSVRLNTSTIRIKRQWLKQSKPIRYFSYLFANWLFGFNFLRIFIRSLDWLLHGKTWYKEIFVRYKPALILSTDIFHPDEMPILEAAEVFKVPIIASIVSWDNLTSKGTLAFLPKKIIVWNDIMALELVRFHNYPKEQIAVCGNPNFDFYKTLNLPSRDEFFRVIGADPKKKLITYATIPPSLNDQEHEIVGAILEAIHKGKIIKKSQLLLRPHPKDIFSAYDEFKNDPNYIFDAPWKTESAFRDQWNPDLGDVVHLAALIKYSDVIINIASTLTIEGAIFNIPVINPKFDGIVSKPYLASVCRIYDFEHYKNIVATRGVRLPSHINELITDINRYLENPELDKEGRMRIVQEQCGFLDGKSAQRIAKLLCEV